MAAILLWHHAGMSLTNQHSHQLINQEVLKWKDYILFDQYYWYYLIKIDRRSRHQMSHSLMKPIAFCSTLEAAADYSSESQCVHSLSVKMKCFSVCVSVSYNSWYVRCRSRQIHFHTTCTWRGAAEHWGPGAGEGGVWAHSVSAVCRQRRGHSRLLTFIYSRLFTFNHVYLHLFMFIYV